MTTQAAQTVLTGVPEVRAAVGSVLGTSPWLALDSARIAQFQEATGDEGATYLALCLSNMFLPQLLEVRGFAMGVNYGTDAVRIVRPLAAGDRIRATATLVSVSDVNGGVQTRIDISVEAAGDGPVCTIEALSRWLGAA